MTNKLKDLTKKIEQWSIDRNLNTANPLKQFDKLVEEYGELVKGLNKQDIQVIKDSIGDMFVVITIMMQQIKGNMYIAIRLMSFGDYDTSTICYINSLNDVGNMLNKFINEEPSNGNLFSQLQAYLSNVIGMLEETAKEYDTDLTSCVQLAYDEIKDRKGKMIDGKFVKESDLQ
ncbi:MazG-like family protein [Staphylococcus lugdunensis]|jgi:NTP pyrophosphatase (non-canonical NTP hydrolase)|uniref:MazG-like family protein n=1 Tax=Staphylococcus TaxID=1279 RepID=UPI0019345C6A|nr:MazG-like family protein [Staphylococcus lugdunensis]QRF15894.1 MazG-like family protein [Staphylococcus lugdunensis]